MSDPAPVDVTATLLAHRHRFKAFLASRIGNETDAEDLLQNGLVKALERGVEIKDDEKAVAWFYRVLKNVIIDHARSRHAATRRDDNWASETAILGDRAEVEGQICGCFEKLLPTLKPAHAELLRRVELQGDSVTNAARELGITANNASVMLHRARAELRAKLVKYCGNCSCLIACECEE